MKTKHSLALAPALALAFAAIPCLSTGSVFEFATSHEGTTEGQGAGDVVVLRRGDANSAAAVDYVTAEVTAKAGVDYIATSGTLDFGAGETFKRISVVVLENGRLDGDRRLTVHLRNPIGAVLGELATMTLEIEDNETPVMVDATFRTSIDGYVEAMAVQPDSRLVIGGSFTNVQGKERRGIARLNPDGSLDERFTPGLGTRGRVACIAVQPEGKILIGGSFAQGNLMRLDPNGEPDSSFKAELDQGEVRQLVLQPDGRMLVLRDGGVTRLNNNGSVDQTFPDLWAWVCGEVRSIALQPDGKMLVGFRVEACGGNSPRRGIIRLNADGSLDEAFRVVVGIDPAIINGNPVVSLIFVQSNGKIVIGGEFHIVNGVQRHLLARLNSDGSLDPTFEAPTPRCCYPISGAVQPDGKVLMSFYLGFPASPLQRFNVDGSVDSTFRTAVYRVFGLLPDGKILVPGSHGPFSQGLLRLFAAAESIAGFTLSHDGDFNPPSESQSPIPVAVASPGRTVQVNVYRLGETSSSATVDFNTRDGTARAGADYVAQAGSLTFSPFETVKTVSIPIVENRELKTERAFSLALQNPSNGGILGIHNETTVTIAPQQYLTIRYPSPAQSGSVRLTLAPTVPGISYRVQGLSNAGFIDDQRDPAAHFYQDKVATGDSLDFEDIVGRSRNQRFYRAIRVVHQR